MAVLDDDDSWAETYLEHCEKEIIRDGLDMVAAGLVFHHGDDAEGEPLAPPDSLNVSDLLVRNTHIQGSNLVVRLRKLLEAGGFDETLASRTDRDLCIRLADLGTVKFGATDECLVHHFADEDRPRLSTPGGMPSGRGWPIFTENTGAGCRRSSGRPSLKGLWDCSTATQGAAADPSSFSLTRVS